MQYFANLIQQGYSHFGSGSYNSEEFNKFFKGFKKAFTTRLKRLNATDIQFSKGHFYLSGFFTVDEQAYYFSISDVRSNWGNPRLLVRTAENYKDYTGGANNYVPIDNHIEKGIARIFGLKLIPKSQDKWDKIDTKAQKIVEQLNAEQRYSGKVSSAKNAMFITWKVMDKLGYDRVPITQHKIGRSLVSCYCKTDVFSMHFDMDSKTLTISISEKKINLEEISNKSRYQDCQQTLLLIKQNLPMFWSWGVQNPTVVNENILRLQVNGHHHKGYVYISVNGSDLFDVYLTTFTGEIVDTIEDLYFDMLADAIDEKIEHVPEYGA